MPSSRLASAFALIIAAFCSSVATAQTPFGGTPIALPGIFEAENFDNGGEGVAYHDNVAGNAGGQYRTGESVDIIVSTDAAGGGYVVNNFETGEWLGYTVDIAAAGQYEIAIRASHNWTGPAPSFSVEIDGVDVTGSVVVPPTGSWNTFQWVAKRGVSLPAGRHVLKLVSESQYFNVNQIRVTATPTTPYAGPIALPGTFEAEHYDIGGEEVSYHDTTATNDGGQLRANEGVDIIASRDALGGGYVVNGFRTGEWLVYTVEVASAGLYDIDARIATGTSTNAAFHIEIDGVNVTGRVVAPATGDFGTFQWVGKKGVSLAAGRHVLKLVSDQEYVDVNQIRVTSVTHSPYGGTPIALPGTFEAENFDLGGEGNAYHDNVAGNAGGQYRTSESVDIIVSRDDAGGGYAVNNFETGEWLAYTVNIASAGSYDVELRLASGATSSARFRIELDGEDVTGSIPVPATGSFGTFQWVGKKAVALPAGQHVLKVVSEQQYFDVNQVRVVASTPPSGEVQFFCSFENSPTDCGFREQAKVPGRATLVNIARHGSKAVRLHTEPGDSDVSGSGARERNDLTLGSLTDCTQGKEHWWAHSVLFPSDFIVPSGTGTGLAMDFHHTGSNGQANFHVRFLRNSSGGEILQFEVNHGDPINPVRNRFTFADPLQRNHWYDFVYHVRWSSGSDGFFDAWVNGEKKLTWRGPTLYPGMGCYLKLANYHSPTAASSIIHDRVIRGTTAGAVALTPLQP